MEPVKNPLSLIFQQVGRRKVGYRTPGELGLAEQGRPELAGPEIDILENVFVNCLQVADVEVASGRLEPQLIHSRTAVQRLERDEIFSVPNAGNVSKDVRSRIEIRV
jgi:hypothetical protein